MDITDEEFSDEFSVFGVEIETDDVYDKLKVLSHMYRLDAGEIATQWVAFAHTHKGCKISPEMLDQLERDRLSSRKGNKAAAKKASNQNVNVTTIHNMQSFEDAVDGEAADLLDAYSTPQSKAKKRQHTPDAAQHKRLTAMGRSPAAAPFSPASFSPATSATPSRKYSIRGNAGESVLNHGPTVTRWRSGREAPVTIAPYDPANTLTQHFKYMFQKLTDKACVLSEQIDELGEQLKKKHNIEELGHVAMPSQDEMTVVGRVCCDSNGKLNAKSVLLAGSRTTSGGRHIPLEVSALPRYSLFPGQVLALSGINSSGAKFVAKTVYEGCDLGLPEKAPAMTDKLSVLVAAGPFTTTDSIMYEPLADLVKALLKDPPDVAILMGPFVDSKNPEVEKSIVDVTYEEFFKTNIIEPIVNATERLSTQLVFVPSCRDIHHTPVYPQPPFKLDNMKNSRVHFVSDPSTLVIDGVVFGFTSTDILFHLGAEEISSGATSDRLARLCQHLLTQNSYYPLHPPHEDVNIDTDHHDVYGKMAVTPHILLVPSDLRFFVKEVLGCCCVNPGRLAKGQVGGTYARVLVPKAVNTRSLAAALSAQVIRV